MSLHRHAAKRDANEHDVSAVWASAGARSESVSAKGMPDRLVFHRGRVYLAEVKGARRGLTKAQVEKFTSLGVDGIAVYVVRTAEDARALLADTLTPWRPVDGARAGAEKKERKHRPGHSNAREISEMCRADWCLTSQLPGKRMCAKHEETT